MQLLQAEAKELKNRGFAIVTILSFGTSMIEDRVLAASDVAYLRTYCRMPVDQFSVILLDPEGKILRQFRAPFRPEVLYADMNSIFDDTVP